jgi:hypothetical protein
MPEKKKIQLDIDPGLPVHIDMTEGNINITSAPDDQCANIEYEPFAGKTPELVLTRTDKNYIKFKNAEMMKINASFNISTPNNIIEAVINEGDFIIDSIFSDVHLTTHKGNINIKNITGRVFASSLSGSINIGICSGKVNLSCDIGEIKVFELSSDGGMITNNTGKITVKLKELNETTEIISKNSRIFLGVEEGLKCTIIARGTDVIDCTKSLEKGESLGSPARIEFNGGGIPIDVFSTGDKVTIARSSDIEKISPDLDPLLDNIEKELRNNFSSLINTITDFGKKAATFGKEFASNLKDKAAAKTVNETSKKGDSLSGEKMEVLKMLSEGKISVTEAERLLKALKE